ncbi:MAG: RNA polymerase factor sigma-54 [Bacteroidales bacterium]|nr:RNA polymerase factor sigma-54 [Bacteroidales bacterium]
MPTTGQRQQQKQQQRLTRQQLFLLELLGKNVDQIEDVVKEEVTQNPLLDPTSLENDSSKDVPVQESGERLLSDEYDEDGERDYRDYLPSDHSADERPEPQIADATSLIDDLRQQLGFLDLDKRQQTICEEIIGSLDDSGYFTTDPAIIVNDLYSRGIATTLSDIESMLRVVQSLDPAGIAAHDAQECMLLQLRRMPQSSSEVATATTIVSRYYDLLMNGNERRIRQQMALDDDEGDKVFALIRRLTLKPAGSDETAYVSPDFIISRQGNRLLVALARGNMPEINFDEDYIAHLNELNDTTKSLSRQQKEEMSFLNKQKSSADMLIDTLHQRQQTLLRVMNAIAEAQHDYLMSGNPSDKRPLMQKEIAQRTGYDPSTISRIVNSKYVQTDFGIIGLDKCFSTSYTTDSGDEVSAEAIKALIHDLVAHEDPRNPLTDEQIADQLNKQGFPIARRTIANYRKDLGIATRHLRRTH